jgi:hypothetical protein
MEINWTQVFVTAITTGVVASFSTISTFLVMRYFPKCWDCFETAVKNGLKSNSGTKPAVAKEKAHG